MILIINVRNVECKETGISESMKYSKYSVVNRLDTLTRIIIESS